MPKKYDNTHIFHFLILLFILLTGAGLTLYFNYSKPYQIASVILFSLSYLSWGIIHHLKAKDFHLYVFLEYLAISFLGSSLLITLILKS